MKKKMIFRDFSDFSIAGNNWKKKFNYHEKKKILVQNLGWATAQVSLRLGWALGAGRAGAGRAGTAQAAWARGRGAHGRWGAGAAGAGLGAAGMGARSGTAWRAGRAGGWAGARTAGRSRRAGRARQARARAERAGQGWLGGRRAAWALGARPGRAAWPWAVHSVHSAHFRSVLTRFFFFFLSHQMNTVHCEIKFFEKKNIKKKYLKIK